MLILEISSYDFFDIFVPNDDDFDIFIPADDDGFVPEFRAVAHI